MFHSPIIPPDPSAHGNPQHRGRGLARRAGILVATGALAAGAFAIAAPVGASPANSADSLRAATSPDAVVQQADSGTVQQARNARQRPTKTTTPKPTKTTTPAPTRTITPPSTPTQEPTFTNAPTPTTPPTSAGEWDNAGTLVTARVRHAAVGLPDGQVLIAGGMTTTTVLNSAEMYSPRTGTWRSVANLPFAVYDAAAVTLPDGTVLVAGGSSNAALFYSPAKNAWTRGSALPAAGNGLAFATTLPDGTVFVLDGTAANRYNPATGTWTALATSPQMRTPEHFSTLDTAQLPNGDIVTLRAMQYVGSMPSSPASGPAVYHWASNTWTLLPSPPQNPGDREVSLAALPNGNVMLSGGTVSYLWSPSTVQTVLEVNPTTGAWTVNNNAVGSRNAVGQLVALPNGSILATGGVNSADLDYVYHPKSGNWAEVTGRNASLPVFAELTNGSVMATGGYSGPSSSRSLLGQAAIFTP